MGRRDRSARRAAGIAIVALLLGACERGAPSAPPTRIVLVTLDTLRFDRLDPGAEGPGVMPRTRAFAERGAQFASFWAASSATQPTHATLFTGLHPWQHGVPRNGTVLTDRHRTLAERLRDAGFATAAVVASFPLESRFGFRQGFDEFHEDFDKVLTPHWEGEPVRGGRFYSLDDVVTTRALQLLDDAPAKPQFFWFHYFDPHEPYGDGRPRPLPLNGVLRRKNSGNFERVLQVARALYDEDVRRLDGGLGVLFERLEADADRFETHVVVTSDHGESFGEHGALGHGSRVTREQVQAPLVIVSPRVQAGIRRDVAGTADLMLTLLSLAGLEDAALPGRDLTQPLPAAGGFAVGMSGSAVPRENLPASPRFFAVRDGVLYAGDSSEVVEDDVEGRAVADAAQSQRLQALFGGFETILSTGAVVEQLDDETQEALRALGYLE